ncbi:MAG: acyl-CoA dehydratase activase [Desulfobacterales bacterium]|jgi:predicted CoA-substrate-specific enzyme activase
MAGRKQTAPFASRIVGVDAGAVSVSVAEITPAGELVDGAYAFHGGRIEPTAQRLLDLLEVDSETVLAATDSAPRRVSASFRCDGRIAVIAAARVFFEGFGALLTVGGERFGIVYFDEEGGFRGFRANTSCAAGTGSFLDQQARRLNLPGPEALAQLAAENTGPVPKIASRCAVFAKTDLVHAQQEGYSLAQICEGLCAGMAKNIVDALSIDPQHIRRPVIFAGGVAKNRAVVAHLEKALGVPVRVHESAHLFGAIGAAVRFAELAGQVPGAREGPLGPPAAAPPASADTAYFPPLALQLSDYPDFSDHVCTCFSEPPASEQNPVEVDLFRPVKADESLEVMIGIDVGSTSTKAVISGKDGTVFSGFYTRTAGRPVQAARAVFAAADSLLSASGAAVKVSGAAVTGAGRKFVGAVVGADLIVDEITAHARAAIALHPAVDTIIEIGGQDAKFTTVKDGRVTFSRMNHVCAAGTGSFIEEQAQRLGCSLADYASRAEGRRAPATSDRCTVFMERDINHYLAEGFDADELLASVLHSVRENYLTKVASEGAIGKTVVFQGATAKNRALVAAFEQRLGLPIHVSKYCHLAGALGAALLLAGELPRRTGFRGFSLHKMEIPVRSEVCDLCPNHCKLTVADLEGEPVAFGFLCGRDYRTRKRVAADRSGYDLLRERKRAFAFRPKTDPAGAPVVGLPAGLHLFEDLSLWKKFFDEIGFVTVTTEEDSDSLATGKRASEAEFCAPTTAFLGQVRQLCRQSDVVFAPFYFDHRDREKDRRRQLCYYTQYAPALARGAVEEADRSRVLTPLLYYLYSPFHTKIALYRCLKQAFGRRIRYRDVAAAYDRALAFHQDACAALAEQYRQKRPGGDDIHVVLLGRPYTVLHEAMNKKIPALFGRQGISAFFQDMIGPGALSPRVGAALAEAFHWHYAARLLAAAEAVAKIPGAYPVLITSFKCAPDSFAAEYFKELMEAFDKPYLVLQLDEHDSRVGYETRIEAAVRSFRNHFATNPGKKSPAPVFFSPAPRSALIRKTVLLPHWDGFSLRLIAAALRREGIDARVLEEARSNISRSLRRNTGQCLPLNIITQNVVDTVRRHHLDPAGTLLWLPHSTIACNIRLYPLHISHLLREYGGGFERVDVYAGQVSFSEVSPRLPIRIYLAYMLGGLLRKAGCRIRPYEKTAGDTDSALEAAMSSLEDAFAGGRGRDEAVAESVRRLSSVKTRRGSGRRPQVAVFGDLYARDNEVFNQDLVRFIERNGGEVVTTPYSEYVRMIAGQYMRKWFVEGNYLDAISSKAVMTAAAVMERRVYRPFESLLGEALPHYGDPPGEILSRFGVRAEHTGESMDNLLKVHYLTRLYPGLSLFVQASPAFCCPSLVTEAMARRIEQVTGIPVASITYDGTGGSKNKALIPYLQYPRRRCEPKAAREA